MEKSAKGQGFDILLIHFYPGTENIADQSYIHAVRIGGIVIHSHVVEHIKNVDTDVLVTFFADEETYTSYSTYNKQAVELLKKSGAIK